MNPHPALAPRTEASQLCQLVTDWTGRIRQWGVIVEPKIDGVRCLYIDGELVTREGATIHADIVTASLQAIEKLYGQPMFFDGELIASNSFDATLKHLRARGGFRENATLHLFDAVPMSGWRSDGFSQPLLARKRELRRRFEDCRKWGELGGISLVEGHLALTVAEAEEDARRAIADGGEGVVLKDAVAPYRRGASKDWQRIKRKLTVDLPICGYIEGSPGRIGMLLLSDQGRTVRVAQGFTDAERKSLWVDRERLVGRIVEVEAMERTATGALRQARFVRERGDKS
jgi:ATP-dependent DNA ligase